MQIPQRKNILKIATTIKKHTKTFIYIVLFHHTPQKVISFYKHVTDKLNY